MQMGLPPGPALGRVLDALLAEVQEEQLANESEALQLRAAQQMEMT